MCVCVCVYAVVNQHLPPGLACFIYDLFPYAASFLENSPSCLL